MQTPGPQRIGSHPGRKGQRSCSKVYFLAIQYSSPGIGQELQDKGSGRGPGWIQYQFVAVKAEGMLAKIAFMSRPSADIDVGDIGVDGADTDLSLRNDIATWG